MGRLEVEKVHEGLLVTDDAQMYKLLKPERSKLKREYKPRTIDNRGQFVMINQSLIKLQSKVSLKDLGYLMYLLPHMVRRKQEKKLNIIVNGDFLTPKVASNLWGVNLLTARKKLHSFLQNRLLLVEKYGKTNYYYINPEYICKGKQLKKDFFTKLYIESIKQMLKSKIDTSTLGFLIKLLPYVNREEQYIRRNVKILTDSADVSFIKKLTYVKDDKTLRKHIKTLKEYGIMQVSDNGKVYINPEVAYCQDNDGTSELMLSVREKFGKIMF